MVVEGSQIQGEENVKKEEDDSDKKSKMSKDGVGNIEGTKGSMNVQEKTSYVVGFETQGKKR